MRVRLARVAAPWYNPKWLAYPNSGRWMMGGLSEGPARVSVETGNPDTDGRVRALLGKSIAVRREWAGLTQVAACELLGVSERTLREWEKGLGTLWTGGPQRTVDHEAMTMLRTVYATLGLARNLTSEPMGIRNQYPNAPLDPVARRRYFWRRNRLIQTRSKDVEGNWVPGVLLSAAELDEMEADHQKERRDRVSQQRGER